ncbi:F0F1 ATP synthase subunit A [Ginsengibacter hankyongi]|uniref:ATP synthase subunit a n=2 Tax=Ginsengibacter hankyongi TaxID=2607284 RepID=A0A5J5IJ06_9BACT|nr:F0F1 ATP synthase subunit A [Ginsengibacter hankyongi]
MRFNRMKSLLVAAFGLIMLSLSSGVFAQENKETGKEQKKGFDANEVIFGHVKDAHEFHFLTYKGSDGEEHEAIIPLPVILYSPQKGFSVFMSSAFHHGRVADGYKLEEGKVVPTDPSAKVYDISLTRNVVQMIIALILFVWLMLAVAKKYKKGHGVASAPSGAQNAIEIVIDFITEQVAKPYLGTRYVKYMPYLLTIFFFILINTFFGMIPGSANVTGNIAFTMVLALIAFVVIMFSTNKHYWGHIINPDVPWWVKIILIPVEILGIFTKPFALMIRLFANMLAGHIIIICLISMIFIFGALNKGIGWGFAPISLAFSIFIYFIEILVAFIQAFIFTNLTAVFIGQAMEGSHDFHNEEHIDPVMV